MRASVASVLVALVAVGIGSSFLHKWSSLSQEGRPFAFLTQHNATNNPKNRHSRLRMNEIEYDSHSQTFFQWWNFIVFDAETGDNWNLLLGLSSEAVQNNSFVSHSEPFKFGKVLFGHRRGSKDVVGGAERVPFERVRTENDFDLMFKDSSGNDKHTLIALDDDTYTTRGSLPNIHWHLTFHRLTGYYGALDQENPSECALSSTLFGFHSAVFGTIEETTDAGETKQYNISQTSRYRAYAAGSWGCMLPGGDPPIEFPWTWFWLVIPADDSAYDIAACGGTGRLQFSLANIEGGYSIARLPPGSEDPGQSTPTDGGVARASQGPVVSTRHIRVFHRSAAELLLQASASEDHWSEMDVTQSDWHMYRDDLGEALLPLVQSFVFGSNVYWFNITFCAEISQYFRAPLLLDGKIFSDFRAVGVKTHVHIVHKTSNHVIFQDTVTTMNAVEYAYAPPVNVAAVREMQKGFPL